MCNILESFIIGLISGIFAGFIVNIFWARFERKKLAKLEDEQKKNDYIDRYSENIQTIARYLGKLQLELGFEENPNKRENVLRAIDSRPVTKSLSKSMNQKGIDFLINIRKIENDIQGNTEIDKRTYKKYKDDLFRLEIDLLKSQNSIRLSWDEYKEKNK